jgi:hypothetical protein
LDCIFSGEAVLGCRAYNSVRIVGEGKQMLDAFIIEELKRRERMRQEHERPTVELPLPAPDERPKRRSETENEDQPQRGVVVIDLCV